ncbi:MAG: hypothetical protein JSS02_02675 [Planctomycetes bacterium]|nr:hypothetical protein [Planctomycetota bacterium]
MDLGTPAGGARRVQPKLTWVRCRRALLIGCVLALLSVALQWFCTPMQYRSSATLLIADTQPFIVFKPLEDSPDYTQNQIELLRSPYIIQNAIKNEDLTKSVPELQALVGEEDPVRWIGQRLRVAKIGRTELYEVSLTAQASASAQVIVKAIIESYMEDHYTEDHRRRIWLQDAIQSELARYGANLSESRAKVRKLMETAAGLGDLRDSRPETSMSDRLAKLQENLIETELERLAVIAKIESLQNLPDEPIEIPADQIDDALARDPVIHELTNELAVLRKCHDEADSKDQPHWLEFIAAKEYALNFRTTDRRPALTAEAEAAVVRQRKMDLRNAQASLRNLESQIELINVKLIFDKNRQIDLCDILPELRFARDELQHLEELHRTLAHRAFMLQTESRAMDRVRLIQPATLPVAPEDTDLWPRLVTTGLIAGLVPLALYVLYVAYGSLAKPWWLRKNRVTWKLVA